MGRRGAFTWMVSALVAVTLLAQRPSAQDLRDESEFARARDLYKRLARQCEIAALSAEPLSPAQIQQLLQARFDTATALTRLGSGERTMAAWIATLDGPVAASDVSAAQALQRASDSIAGVEKWFAGIDTTARSIGADKGRIVISREQAIAHAPADALEKQADATRLPDRLAAWQGFVNPRTRKPYDYERDVKNFRDFSPVGGGVHMGA